MQRASGKLVLHFRKVGLGDREVRVDRVQPLNEQQPGAIRLHHISYIDEPHSRPAVDR